MKERPHIGTRKDCIARSSALSINRTRNSDGFQEGVTCDLYNFGHHRRHECVCFPVFSDRTETVTYETKGIQSVTTTTSVFYPPEQVIQNYLLAAAQGGSPKLCTKNCIYQADVLMRSPRHLGDFPYCPFPGQNVQFGLVPQTVSPSPSPGSLSDSFSFPSTTSPPPLPTETPVCPMDDPKDKRSQCSLDQCLWSFLDNITTTTSNRVTFTDKDGAGLYYDWNTTVYLITGTHWGTLPSELGGGHIASQTSGNGRVASSLAKQYAAYRTGIGLPPKHKAGDTDSDDENEKHRPVCTDESTCRQYCYDKDASLSRAMFLVIGFGALISAIALFGMLYRMVSKHRRSLHRKNCANPQADVWYAPSRQARPQPPVAEPEMESVIIDTERGPVVEFVEAPAQSRTTGTLSRVPEEGTSRRRGGKRARIDEATFEGSHDGTVEGVRKVSGRDSRLSLRGGKKTTSTPSRVEGKVSDSASV